MKAQCIAPSMPPSSPRGAMHDLHGGLQTDTTRRASESTSLEEAKKTEEKEKKITEHI